jgi:leader peptidase (prepilin peptidase)/N-methyltransferase
MWWTIPPGWNLITSIVLVIYFGLVTTIDVEHRLILHSVSLVGACLAFVVGTWQHGLWRTLAGGAVGFTAMLGLYWLGMLFIRFQKRRQGLVEPEDALGFGDVNLSGVIGLLLGWPGIIAGLVLAILLAGGFSLAYLIIKLIRREYRPSLVIPYGPFLALSAAWLWVFRGM